MTALLRIKNLCISFNDVHVVRNMNFSIQNSEIVGVVGESGSGKSITMLAVMGLVDHPGKVYADNILFNGENLLHTSSKARRRIVGKDIAMIFQDPNTSLNPSYTVGYQIAESLKTHTRLRGKDLSKRILDLLDMVEIPDVKSRVKSYPHELSGGMSQRVMIAMAIACDPILLIADEPTTALDVTIQAQILDLLVMLQKQNNMALIFISHDLSVIAEIAHRVVVMYAGEVIEQGIVPNIFIRPAHPYTESLIRAIPEYNVDRDRLYTLPGNVPNPSEKSSGCLLSPRCPYADDHCHAQHPLLLTLQNKEDQALRDDFSESSIRCFKPVAPPIHCPKPKEEKSNKDERT